MILPAALRYQGEVAATVNADQGRRRRQQRPGRTAQEPDGDDQRVPEGDRRRWTRLWRTTPRATCYAHAKYFRDDVLPAMADVRTLGDKLETMVADDLWPLPTYREMLFIK